jgi:activating signal cointegrator 1
MAEVEVRVLSLLQPWASLLVFGEKRVETRSWKTAYRGPVAIHAGLNDEYVASISAILDPFINVMCRRPDYISNEERQALLKSLATAIDDYQYMRSFEQKLIDHYGSCSWNFGKIVGIGMLVDCVPTSQIKTGLSEREISLGDYSEGRWAWKFEEMRPIEPIGMKGALGLRRIYLPEEVVNG